MGAAPQRLFKLAAGAETDQEHVWVYRFEAEGPFRLDPMRSSAAAGAPEEVTRWMGRGRRISRAPSGDLEEG